MISYDLPLGMAIASVVLFVGSLSVVDIAAAQENWWFIFLNPIGGIIFIIAVFAESNRTPFDIVEAEKELVGGFHKKYSSMKLGIFFLAERMHVNIWYILITTFYYGSFFLAIV